MKFFLFLFVPMAALGSLGCATIFYDSAPADDGGLYVAGGKVQFLAGWQPTVWKCPGKPNSGECVEVED